MNSFVLSFTSKTYDYFKSKYIYLSKASILYISFALNVKENTMIINKEVRTGYLDKTIFMTATVYIFWSKPPNNSFPQNLDFTSAVISPKCIFLSLPVIGVPNQTNPMLRSELPRMLFNFLHE